MKDRIREAMDEAQPRYITVAREINKHVIANNCKPGDKLPSEEYFQKKLKASRAVIREAVKVLAAMGLVRVQRGSGLYVDNQILPFVSLILNPDVPADVRTVIELYEYRIILEVSTAKLAAEHITPRELQKLRQAVDGNLQSAREDNRQEFLKSDAALHQAIAEGSHNSFLASAIVMIARMQNWVFEIAAGGPLESREILAGQHWEIFQAIEQGLPDVAAEKMKFHLETAQKNYQRQATDRFIKEQI